MHIWHSRQKKPEALRLSLPLSKVIDLVSCIALFQYLYFSQRKTGQWVLWLCHFLIALYLTNCNNNYYFSIMSDDITHLPERETAVHISWPTVTVCHVQENTCYVCRTCLTLCMIVRCSSVFFRWKIMAKFSSFIWANMVIGY